MNCGVRNWKICLDEEKVIALYSGVNGSRLGKSPSSAYVLDWSMLFNGRRLALLLSAYYGA
jgi:hypothetical protein